MLYCLLFFFFNDTATTEIYTLSLHDALPISARSAAFAARPARRAAHRGLDRGGVRRTRPGDRKSTRLNSSHSQISYAVFCLKKKTKTNRLPSATAPFTNHSALSPVTSPLPTL